MQRPKARVPDRKGQEKVERWGDSNSYQKPGMETPTVTTQGEKILHQRKMKSRSQPGGEERGRGEGKETKGERTERLFSKALRSQVRLMKGIAAACHIVPTTGTTLGGKTRPKQPPKQKQIKRNETKQNETNIRQSSRDQHDATEEMLNLLLYGCLHQRDKTKQVHP